MASRFVLSQNGKTWKAYNRRTQESFYNDNKSDLIKEIRNSLDSTYVKLRKQKLVVCEKIITQ